MTKSHIIKTFNNIFNKNAQYKKVISKLNKKIYKL